MLDLDTIFGTQRYLSTNNKHSQRFHPKILKDDHLRSVGVQRLHVPEFGQAVGVEYHGGSVVSSSVRFIALVFKCCSGENITTI